jgi:hypothetical protein
MGNKILRFKIWEDAAANSAGGGSVDGIGVGAKGEPGVHMKKKKKKKKEIVFNPEDSGRQYKAGSQGKADEWEKRAKTSRDVRANMWKDIIKKGKARLKKKR